MKSSSINNSYTTVPQDITPGICAYVNMRDAMERLTIMKNTINFLNVVEALRKMLLIVKRHQQRERELKEMDKWIN